jgi:hypothetical protein
VTKAAKAPKPGPGRPSLYTPEVAERIFEGLSRGTPLTVICREDGMPSDNTVHRWVNENAAFSKDFALAREAGYDAIALRARLTIRGKTEDDGGGESTGDVQRDKAIVDLDLKLLSKWSKRYADKVEHQHGGEVGMRVVRKMYALPEPAKPEPAE